MKRLQASTVLLMMLMTGCATAPSSAVPHPFSYSKEFLSELANEHEEVCVKEKDKYSHICQALQDYSKQRDQLRAGNKI